MPVVCKVLRSYASGFGSCHCVSVPHCMRLVTVFVIICQLSCSWGRCGIFFRSSMVGLYVLLIHCFFVVRCCSQLCDLDGVCLQYLDCLFSWLAFLPMARQGLVHDSFVVVHDWACVLPQFGLFFSLWYVVQSCTWSFVGPAFAKGAIAAAVFRLVTFLAPSFSIGGGPSSVLHCPLGFWGHSAWPFSWLSGIFP